MQMPNLEERRYFLPPSENGLECFEWESKAPARAVILVVANSYGVLNYCSQLCRFLSAAGNRVLALNFRGQGESPGKLSLSNATEDFCIAYKKANSVASGTSLPFFMINHCTGVFPLLFALEKNNFLIDDLKLLIMYAYLHNPRRLYSQTLKKMERFSVRYDPNIFNEVTDSNFFEKYKYIQIPFQVFHPLIRSNLVRASVEELEQLSITKPDMRYCTPEFGYEILDDPQNDVIWDFTKTYYLPIINEELIKIKHN